jgi:cytochrome c peroxidase
LIFLSYALVQAAVALPQESYAWDLPAGFPAPLVTASNPMSAGRVELGRLLFYDTRLSGNGSLACAGCHRPELAFTDGRARALGATGETHARSAMSLANVAYNATLTWADPALKSLEDQALVPLMNMHPVEMGAGEKKQEILQRLAWDLRYPGLFGANFPGRAQPITWANIVRAIAAFERALISGRSAYDRLLYADEEGALGQSAKRGMRLFFSPRIGCSGCHGGFNFSGPVDYVGAPEPEPSFHNTGLYNLRGEGAYPAMDRGLFEHSGLPADMGRFRAPTLRNIAVTAPYMHDGSIASLPEVVAHYASGGRIVHVGPNAGVGRENPFKSERLRGFGLGPGELEDLVAFLHSLTDEGFLRDPRLSDPWAKDSTPARAEEAAAQESGR